MLFGAAVGVLLAGRYAPPETAELLGPFDANAIGLIVGAGAGYVVGGVLSRWAVRAVDRGERTLEGLSPEQVVAGSVGGGLAVVVAAAVCWPVFLLGPPLVMLPVFLFLLLLAGMFGFRVARRRRDAVLATAGGRGGLARRVQAAGARPRVVDTSIAVDGRVTEVVRSGFLHGRLWVPDPVVSELQRLADSSDDLRRAKGRRGLDCLEALRAESGVDVEVIPDEAPEVAEVDGKLVRICLKRGAALLTLDTNLAKVASLAGVQVMNLHQLALAMRPPVAVGEEVGLVLSRPGRDAGQAVGHLDDGTMIVVEHARDQLGADVVVTITSVLTTPNGRMAFARLTERPPARPAGHHDPAETMTRRPGSGR